MWRASSMGPHLRVRVRATRAPCSMRPASGKRKRAPAGRARGGSPELSAIRRPDTIPNMPVSVTAPRGLTRLVRPLRALVAAVLRAERRRAGEISLVLSDDVFMRQINHDWRGIDRATDVISFA